MLSRLKSLLHPTMSQSIERNKIDSVHSLFSVSREVWRLTEEARAVDIYIEGIRGVMTLDAASIDYWVEDATSRFDIMAYGLGQTIGTPVSDDDKERLIDIACSALRSKYGAKVVEVINRDSRATF